MKEKGSLIQDLENYRFDKQYHQERSKDVKMLDLEIAKLKAQVLDMEHKHYDTTSINIQIDALHNRLTFEEKALKSYEQKRCFIEHKIENMSQPYKNILFLKYIKGYSFDEIASKMNYSSKKIYQLHKDAITNYCEKYKL